MAEGPVPANPLEGLGEHVLHLQEELRPLAIWGDKAGTSDLPVIGVSDWSLTTYMLWFVIAAVLTMLLLLLFKKKQAAGGLAPKGRFVNAVEFLVEFVQRDIVDGAIDHGGKKHVPFIATVFFFVLINNVLGLIPSFKAGTGTVAGTAAIAVIVFVYFNYHGIKAKGPVKYFTGLVPHGVPGWIAWLVWLIEFASLLLRPVTQALRLFANMYAGHIILGIFAMMTTLFLQSAIAHGAVLTGLPSVVWLVILIALYMLEVLVAAIQAYVFALLTAVYVNSSISDH